MLCENNLFTTFIEEIAGNYSTKMRKIGKKGGLDLGVGWEIYYKIER